MSRNHECYQVRPFPKIRHAYLDILAAGRRRHLVHGLVEVDVTDARRRLHAYEAATGVRLSFTAFLTHCVARAVEADPLVHAYRLRNQLILFDDVDVNIQIEAEAEGQKIVQSLLVRRANAKTVPEISREIRDAQERRAVGERRYQRTMAFLTLPSVVRSVALRAVMGNPFWFKRFGGTVGVSAVGMFGAGGGWGIPIAPCTLMVTVGGIAAKPRYVTGDLCEREMLGLTLTFDHAIVDGAPAARFIRRLTDLVQSGDGLPDVAPTPAPLYRPLPSQSNAATHTGRLSHATRGQVTFLRSKQAPP
jgi:chloramphenicol O-acetyltransferase